MKFTPTPLPGVILVDPDVYRDPRGFFLESYNAQRYRDGGIRETFVQDNHSRSRQGILRGLHAQIGRPQGKLVRVLAGEIFDVVVDIRRGSPTFKRWFGAALSGENFRQCYIPPGFAHGFCVLSETADVEYKVSGPYDPSDELSLLWNDPDFGIDWPVKNPQLSAKDQAGFRLRDIEPRLPVYSPS